MRAFASLAAAAALVASASLAMAQDGDGSEPRRLSVSGEGRVAVSPDMAIVTLGAVAEDREAEAAMREMGASMSAVLEKLYNLGIAERDVQTSSLSLSPLWGESRSYESGREIQGFQASSQATVRIRDLDSLGGILDAVLTEGANDFRGLQFDLQEPQPHRDAARREAVADARRKAELYAEAAGVSLGPVLEIVEQGTPQPYMMRAEAAAMSGGAMPVAAGELEITTSVSITWALEETSP